VESETGFEKYNEQFSRMSLLKSSNTIRIFGLLFDMENNWLYLVMEYLPNGSLEDYFKKNKPLS